MKTHALVVHLGAWSSGKGPLHQKLARALMGAVRHGLVSPGLRLPSERRLAAALSISRTTVVAAYGALRERGWVDSRSGSGTWVSAGSSAVTAARDAAQTAALATSPLLGLLDDRLDDDVVDFALGVPAPLSELPAELFALPPDEHAALLRDRLYHPLGLTALRRAIAAEFSTSGLDTREEQILVTNGAQHAITLCAIACLQRGDTVLVEDPAYFGALDACQLVGARMAALPVGVHGVPPAAIRDRIAATAPRLIYLTPTFQNPTGSVMPDSARKEVGRLVSEFGVPMIDDRTMADLVLDGSPPLPIAAFAPRATIFTVGSLSKLVWPGLRVGWIRAPAPAIQRVARVKSAMDLGSPLLTQAIGVRVVGATGEARRLRARQLRPRRDLLTELLRRHLPTWSFRTPAGGLFLWVKLPGGDAREFAQVARRHRVIVLPGPLMSPAEEHPDFLRVPFLGSPDTLRAGVSRLSSAWREYGAASRQRRGQEAII